MFIKEPPGQLPIFDVRYQGQSVTKLIVSTDDVYKRLMSLKVSKSMGPDNCHPHLMKDLGILFEKKLKFNKHVTVKRANKSVGLIRRTFSFMD